jgi:hypothetical protein
MAQFGVNALSEVLKPGRVPDCYLGLLLDSPGQTEPAGVLVVAPASLLHPAVPQPDGTVLYELLTGHPDRAPRELVFLADLTVELRARPADTWTKVRIDPQAAARAVVAGWQRGDLLGPAAGRADRRGGPGLGAASHDLRARPARRPPPASARSGLPAVAAPVQRPHPVASCARLTSSRTSSHGGMRASQEPNSNIISPAQRRRTGIEPA